MFQRRHSGAALFVLLGCSFDWDAFDPRLGAAQVTASSAVSSSASSGVGGNGSGGSALGGAGGMELVPFGPPQLVMTLSSNADDDDPCVSGDGLEIFFNSDRSGDPAIWSSTRASTNDPWGMPVYVAELDSVAIDTDPLLSHDGLTMWLSSDRDAPGLNRDIYVSARASRASAWSTPVVVEELSTPSAYEYPCGVSADELTLIIQANDRVHRSTRSSKSEPWGAKMVIAELDTGAAEGGGWLGEDKLHLGFESTKDGTDRDLYLASRRSAADPFAPIVHLMELDLGTDETDASLTNDLRHIVFTVGNTGSERDIYEASR